MTGAERRPAGADLVVRELTDPAELQAANDLWTQTWGAPEASLTADVLRALAHAGGYVGGAFRDGELVGAGAGWLGRDDVGGPLHLHSHIVGVRPGQQRTGVGLAVKLHQREWALGQGIHQMRWTFDPILARNAAFNLGRLGALPLAYHPDFYGELDDDYNAGDPTDRVVVAWELDRPWPPPAVSADEAVAVLASDAASAPSRSSPEGAELIRVEIPSDYVALRRRDPATASAWRSALRECLAGALAEGWAAAGWQPLVGTTAGGYLLRRGKGADDGGSPA